jgi:hypothetical protein
MRMFLALSPEQEQSFRQWARDNYVPFDPIKGIWHPVVQSECAAINQEVGEDISDKALTTGVYPTFRLECSE